MPSRKSPSAMTPAEFRAVLAATGLTRSEAAARLGVSANAVYAWATGRTPIGRGRARLIRTRLTPAGPAGPAGRTPGVPRVASHQAEYQRAARDAGLCSRCFARPLQTRWECAACVEKSREAARRRLGCKPWQKGKQGRPPKGAPK